MDCVRTFTVLTIILCSHLVATEFKPDPALCPDVPDNPLHGLLLPMYPQDFITTIELNHVNSSSPKGNVDGNTTTIFKVVRGMKRGKIEWVRNGFFSLVLYDFGRKQMIMIEEDEYRYNCGVTKLGEGSDWIVNPSSSGSHVPEFGTPEWLFRYVPDEQSQTYLGTFSVRGIPSNAWRVCSGDDKVGTVVAYYYWSDPSQWTPILGKDDKGIPFVVPVAINITARRGKEEYSVIFSSFTYDPVPANEHEFEIPKGKYCEGLSSEEIKAPNISKFFSFDSEVVIFQDPGDFVSTQKHLYDSNLNMTRLDISLGLDPYGAPTKIEELTYIEDFQRMVSFLIDRKQGNCTVERINAMSGNVVIRNGTLSIADPFTALHGGANMKNLVYYKTAVDRGILGQVFMSPVNRGVKRGELVQEWWYTSAFVTVQENQVESNIPMKIVEYSKKDSDLNHTEWNIFNYDASEPDIFLYDVSSCFHGEGRRHFKLNLDRAYDQINPNDEEQLRYSIYSLLIMMTGVSPLRVNNIQLDSYGSETIVIFTILGKLKIPEPIKEFDTDVVIDELKLFLDSCLFNVPYVDKKGNKVTLRGIPGSLEEVERYGDGNLCWKDPLDIKTESPNRGSSSGTSNPNEGTLDDFCETPTTKNSSCDCDSGYSGGSMAGIAIGMILLGSVIGVLGGLVYFIKFRP